MMTDIVERLRATGGKGQGGPLKKEAADEIRKLRAIIASAQPVPTRDDIIAECEHAARGDYQDRTFYERGRHAAADAVRALASAERGA